MVTTSTGRLPSCVKGSVSHTFMVLIASAAVAVGAFSGVGWSLRNSIAGSATAEDATVLAGGGAAFAAIADGSSVTHAGQGERPNQTEYPAPELRIDSGNGRLLCDELGCRFAGPEDFRESALQVAKSYGVGFVAGVGATSLAFASHPAVAAGVLVAAAVASVMISDDSVPRTLLKFAAGVGLGAFFRGSIHAMGSWNSLERTAGMVWALGSLGFLGLPVLHAWDSSIRLDSDAAAEAFASTEQIGHAHRMEILRASSGDFETRILGAAYSGHADTLNELQISFRSSGEYRAARFLTRQLLASGGLTP